jgi:hypothetical protein
MIIYKGGGHVELHRVRPRGGAPELPISNRWSDEGNRFPYQIQIVSPDMPCK